MSEAIITIKDAEGTHVEVEVDFEPQLDNDSRAHWLACEFLKMTGEKADSVGRHNVRTADSVPARDELDDDDPQ